MASAGKVLLVVVAGVVIAGAAQNRGGQAETSDPAAVNKPAAAEAHAAPKPSPPKPDGTTGTGSGSGTSTRHATQPASSDWNAVTEHMVHTTPGADLPIPWVDGVRHMATCSNGSHVEWVEGTAAEMCEPYHVIEQH